MQDKQGNIVRNSILEAMNNYIENNEKKYSYDKTDIARVIAVNANGTYKIKINRGEYDNIETLNGLKFSVNDIVRVSSPRNNMTNMKIVGGSKDQFKDYLKDGNQDINGMLNFLNGIKIGGLQLDELYSKIDGSNVNLSDWINLLFTGDVGYGDKIISKSLASNGYIKYQSGIMIVWGMATGSGDVTTSYPLAFTTIYSLAVSADSGTSSNANKTWEHANVFNVGNSQFSWYGADNYSMRYIAIGEALGV